MEGVGTIIKEQMSGSMNNYIHQERLVLEYLGVHVISTKPPSLHQSGSSPNPFQTYYRGSNTQAQLIKPLPIGD